MKVLLLSGGSNKGAYQVGALQHLLSDQGTQYSSLHGISVGAIIAAFLAQFPIGEEKKSWQELSELWSKIDVSHVYKRWSPLGKWQSLWKKSLFDSSPLHDLIRSSISLDKIRLSGKMATIGVVSLNSGEYKTIDQSNDRFIDFVIASSSFPIFFSPIKIDNEWFIDGGIKQISPFKTAIDLGAVDIDAIITSPQFRDKSFSDNPNIIDIIKRIINLSSDKIISDDINQTLMYNQLALMGFSGKKVINMNIIRPKESLSDNALDFDLTKIKKMMETGYKDAKNFGKTEKKENDIHN